MLGNLSSRMFLSAASEAMLLGLRRPAPHHISPRVFSSTTTIRSLQHHHSLSLKSQQQLHGPASSSGAGGVVWMGYGGVEWDRNCVSTLTINTGACRVCGSSPLPSLARSRPLLVWRDPVKNVLCSETTTLKEDNPSQSQSR